MKVALINPPSPGAYSNARLAKGRSPSIALACLAAYAREYGHDVRIVDMDKDRRQLYQALREGFDVAGITSLTPNYKECGAIIKYIKKERRSSTLVMGGVHISALPRETLAENEELDFGVVGEGEVTFKYLLDWLALERKDTSALYRIGGLCFRDNGKIVVNKRRELIEDLDQLPFPAYDLLDVGSYELKPHHLWSCNRINIKPVMSLFTSRGCSHRCGFCASHVIWENKPRYRSPGKVLKEIDTLVNSFGVRVLYIYDDSFVSNRKNAMVILDGLIQRDYDLNFLCNARADQLDEELILKLKEAKCHLIRIGVESCSEQVLKAMGKGSSPSLAARTFALCREIGIAASASLVIGYPPETWETFRETLDKIKKINPVACEFFIAVPFVGTDLYAMAREKGYLLSQPWQEWKQVPEKPVLRTPSLSPRELIEMQKIAFREFYFRIPKIMELLKQVNSGGKLRYYLKGLLSVVSLIIKNPRRNLEN